MYDDAYDGMTVAGDCDALELIEKDNAAVKWAAKKRSGVPDPSSTA